MKNMIRNILLPGTLFLAGCLPQEQLTGRVIDLTGPVPNAAVLGMVWIEDTDKAKPEPAVEGLKPGDRDAAYEADMKERGLPVGYARGFTGKDGWFKLNNIYFSAETKKAVKAMKQPRITRITLCAFQRGYLKRAVTLFQKRTKEEVPPATILLYKPENWTKLSTDSSFETLKQPEYNNGYSKEFGATKEEKDWFLEYTYSNLWKAYTESDIKSVKEWEEACGHDYSGIIVSTAGMQRDPAHEKCAWLLWQMGVLREWENRWLDHALIAEAKPNAVVTVVKRMLDGLGAEYAEVKANEAQILAGVTDAEKDYDKNQTDRNLGGGPAETGATIEAQRLYNIGDKAGAYKALGCALYAQIPAEIKLGTLTSYQAAKTLPDITATVAGFYRIMNRPLTAQAPGGDDGNHKDKPGYKVAESTETIEVTDYESFQKYVAELEKKAVAKAPKQEGKSKIVELEKLKTFRLPNGKILRFSSATGLLGNERIIHFVHHYGQDRVNKGFAHHLEVYDLSGVKIFEVSFDGEFSFTWLDDKLYLFTANRGMDPGQNAKNGFYIYDAKGDLLKFYEVDWIDYAFSKSGIYLAVFLGADGDRENITRPATLVVYAANKTEYWRELYRTPVLADEWGNNISFSPDDRYMMFKARGGLSIADYNESELQNKGTTKRYKWDDKAKGATYIFDMSNDFRLIFKERR